MGNIFKIFPPTEECDQALGMERQTIRNSQIFGGSEYNNDHSKYGSQNARLHNPLGYRADPSASVQSNMIGIRLEEDMVITTIATQGYGDPGVSEWVTSFNVFYQNSFGHNHPVKRTDGKALVRVKRTACVLRRRTCFFA